MKTCPQCHQAFELNDADQAFLKRFDVPEPTICPACRFQNRIAFRNEQRFYRRVCDLCQEPTISVYSQDKPYKVYCSACWWSDRFDPLAYGRIYDENRSFFEQLRDLAREVPKPAIMNMKSENCDYTNYSSENRNCYFVIGTAFSEDCYYSYRIFSCKNVMDCYDLQKSELCYECSQSRNLYNCLYCESCEDSSGLVLCNDCVGCHDCFGSVNLRNKKFHIFNQSYSEVEYRKKVALLRQNWAEAGKEYQKLRLSLPLRASHIINCQNCAGDQLANDKNCTDCFSLHNSEECRLVIWGDRDRFMYDVNFTDGSELMCNSMSCDTDYNILAANLVWYTKNSGYVTQCFNSNDLFGCVGMKRHQFCILNKQYSREDYDALKQKIVDQMKVTGEWGKYYPMSHSPFAYNETLAQEYFPLTKEEVLKRGLQWKDDIDEIPTKAVGSAIRCEVSGKPFKLIAQELAFYEKMGLPKPHLHPFERHQIRMQRVGGFKLHNRQCDRCHMDIQTTISPAYAGIVYCEPCYLQTVY